jgi:hypothetical protein
MLSAICRPALASMLSMRLLSNGGGYLNDLTGNAPDSSLLS